MQMTVVNIMNFEPRVEFDFAFFTDSFVSFAERCRVVDVVDLEISRERKWYR